MMLSKIQVGQVFQGIYGKGDLRGGSRIETENIPGEIWRVSLHCFSGYIWIVNEEEIPSVFHSISIKEIESNQISTILNNRTIYLFGNAEGRMLLRYYYPSLIETIEKRNEKRFNLHSSYVQEAIKQKQEKLKNFFIEKSLEDVLQYADIQRITCRRPSLC